MNKVVVIEDEKYEGGGAKPDTVKNFMKLKGEL
jgi:hypothetical protein